MFRRLPNSLPVDPLFSADLEKLGYFINDDDKVRSIHNPAQKFQYKINRNERVNDVHRNAMNTCVRRIVSSRLTDLGLEVVRLPLGVREDEKHVPILVSKHLKSKKRVLVLFGERSKDLGIFSFRTIGDEGINAGSAIGLVNAVLNEPGLTSHDDVPGMILANPGQLLWYRGGARAVSDQEWLDLPRASAVHEAFRIDPVKNRVEGNASYGEHVQYIFENIMRGQTHPQAKFDIIGLEYTGTAVVYYLADHWIDWSKRVNGICLGNPQHTIQELNNSDFVDFMARRTRAYFLSDALIESPVLGCDRFGCSCYASGEEWYEEGILIKSWRSMLDWFNMISVVTDYAEPSFSMMNVESGEYGNKVSASV